MAQIDMGTVSACIVAYNGEKQIVDCLESIKDVVDEIIVVHDGPCKDRTLELCRKYTSKIYVRPYVGEAEPHRPFSFKKATGEWILWIDQDEQLTRPLRKTFRKLLDNKSVNAYTFLWPVKYMDYNLKNGFFSRVRKRALFRKDAIDGFRGLPNETLNVKGTTLDTNYWFIHEQSGERNTLDIFFKRTLRIVKIHAHQMIIKKIVSKPAIWYLIKAPIWFVLYLGYYYVLKCAIWTKADRSISLQLALYNFYLYWYVFKEKMNLM
jgi:glycosyltransferase involved in cell wall biosynthesis